MMRVRARLQPSQIDGIGIFALEKIPAGTVVWEHDPILDPVLPLSVRDNAHPVLREWLFRYAWVQNGMLYIAGDEMRYMNHQPTPYANCFAAAGADNSVALRDIEAGEELTEDYQIFDEESKLKVVT